MKKVLLFMLAIILVFSFVACGRPENNSYSQNKNDIEKESAETITSSDGMSASSTAGNENFDSVEKYNQFYEFSESKAWVEYVEGGKTQIGCMDTKGKMLFRLSEDFSNKIIEPRQFKNGISVIEVYRTIADKGQNETVYVIDKNGNIINKYNDIASYGDGYSVNIERVSGYDKVCYEYTFSDSNGKSIYKYKTEGDNTVFLDYVGKGVFRLGNNLFFAKTQKIVGAKNVSGEFFNNEYIIVDNNYLIDTDGNMIKGNDTSDKLRGFNSNYLIYVDDSIYTYNITEKKMYTINDTSIKDHIYKKSTGTEYLLNFSKNDDNIVIPLLGEDGEYYAVILDYKMNVIGNPVKCSTEDDFEAYDNHTIRIGSNVYDSNGTMLFSLADKGFTTILSGPTRETEIYLAYSGNPNQNKLASSLEKNLFKDNNFAFLNKEGEFIFDKIDFSNCKTVN